MKPIEKGTYGSSVAAIDLTDILNKTDSSVYNKRVSRILTDYFVGMIDIRNTKNVKEELFKMWRDRYTQRTIDANLPIDISDRVRNLIVGRYRAELKKYKKSEEYVRRNKNKRGTKRS